MNNHESKLMDQINLQLTGGNNKGNRRKLDFYPTPKNVTTALLNFLNIPKHRLIWEPACGTGAMSEVIEHQGYKVISTDINLDCYGVGGIDFLLSDFNPKADVIITNPPFNLSQQFIEKSLERARMVCMLLKSQYWHASKRFDLFEKTNPAYILPLTWRPDFLEHERKEYDKKGAPTMEVAWTVWDKNYNGQTQYKLLRKP